MKKIIGIMLAAFFLCSVFAGCDISTFTDPFSAEGDDIKYVMGESSAKVIEVSDKASMKEIIIPDEYEGLPVTEIAEFAISNLRFVEKVSIGKNVEKIGEWALRNNSNMTQFTVSEDNPYLCDIDGVIYNKEGTALLYYPTGRKGAYTIAEGTETVGTKAFYKCTGLTGITFPEGVKAIDEMAFFRCSLEELTLPEGIERIGKDAFSYCSSIKSLVIPGSIKEIGDYAFYSCTSMLDIKVEAKETDISLGEKWYPTQNGIEIGDLKLEFAK